MLIMMFIALFNAIFWGVITGLSVPELMLEMMNAIVLGIYTVFEYIPTHPAIPWGAIIISIEMTVLMLGIGLLYNFARTLASLFLFGG